MGKTEVSGCTRDVSMNASIASCVSGQLANCSHVVFLILTLEPCHLPSPTGAVPDRSGIKDLLPTVIF